MFTWFALAAAAYLLWQVGSARKHSEAIEPSKQARPDRQPVTAKTIRESFGTWRAARKESRLIEYLDDIAAKFEIRPENLMYEVPFFEDEGFEEALVLESLKRGVRVAALSSDDYLGYVDNPGPMPEAEVWCAASCDASEDLDFGLSAGAEKCVFCGGATKVIKPSPEELREWKEAEGPWSGFRALFPEEARREEAADAEH